MLLKDIVIIYALAAGVVYLFHRIKLPPVVGFLLTGVLAGPHGFGLISSVHEVETLAEIGIILLLFTIGLEFSTTQLKQMRRPALLGGALQVGLTVAVSAGVALALGERTGQAVFAGFILALSSTAIVLKLLQDKAALDGPTGRTSLGILLFQDVAVVAMLLAMPFLAATPAGAKPPGEMGWELLAKGLAAVAIILVGARWVFPHLMHRMAATRNRELFIIAVVVVLLGVTWLTSWAGLSLALGAFLAGLILAGSRYSHQAIGSVIPMRDLFTSLFFVSIGMLMDLSFLLAHPGWVALGTGLVLLGKSLLAGGAALALRLPLRVALGVGLTLSQVGEFSFVLARGGIKLGLLSQNAYQLMLDVAVLTMALTPALVWAGQRLARSSPLLTRLRHGGRAGDMAQEHGVQHMMGHVMVVGYGINGQNVTRAAKSAGIPYVVVEMNSSTVNREAAKGEPIIFGDAMNPAVLEHAGLSKARVLVVAIADPVAARHIVATAKDLNPALYVIARTRFLQEMPALYDLGADEVVPEEYETAVEIFARVLRRFLVPQGEIERQVAALRAEGYEMLRGLAAPSGGQQEICRMIPDVNIATLQVHPGAVSVGKTIAELGLRKKHGVTALAVSRGDKTTPNPGADTILNQGDYLVILAEPEAMEGVRALFR
ncbi:MAG: cation:proton antiporter [Desulfarculaceae bacterium]|nr:cation:proton antiporter [Desulfarculaceae bacterium]MCF8073770.1 cation:proton antiporter [Desulfarculaceae bacterium]MCF8102011.1 cation:proton antiporter [Desulfarculaceae bacterium]MCF8115981.1 cation:proton antiporter [Desulfarculaceae bacterium]